MRLRALRPDDMEQAWSLDSDAFHVPAERKAFFLRFEVPERFSGLFDGERLVAMTGVHALRQYFGGRSVPMGGLASVVVVPDWRGRGCARRVIAHALGAMRERGEVISTLFPATVRLYRGLGWEIGGSSVWRRIAPAQLSRMPAPASGRVRPAAESDRAALRDCYARVARLTNGFVDRSDAWWERQGETWSAHSVFVFEGERGGIDGYVVYRQIDGEWSVLGGSFGLAVRELVHATGDAGRALWRLLGSWGTQADQILHRGTSEDALLLLDGEQAFTTLATIRWMTRVVDPAGAVEARGFAPGVEAEVHLDLRDEQLADNGGRWLLTVHKGRGRLEPGGEGRLAVDVGAFSSLYTGWASTATLARAGRLRGGSDEERAALDAAFAGPTPWMVEEF